MRHTLLLTFANALILTLALSRKVDEFSWVEKESGSKSLWQPEVPQNYFNDHFLFAELQKGTFKDATLPEFKRKYKSFVWNSIAISRSYGGRGSFMILGGSQRKVLHNNNNSNDTERVIGVENSLVIMCKLEKSNEAVYKLKFDPNNCEELKEDASNVQLGMSVDAVELDDNRNLVSFCDPLWRMNGSPYPAGRCFMLSLNKGKIEDNKEFENECALDSEDTLNCMFGFSSAIEFKKSINKISTRLWVGAPLANSKGKLFMIDDPMKERARSRTLEDVNQNTLNYMGFSVVPGYSGSPSYGFNLTSASDARFIRTSSKMKVDWFGAVSNEEEFFGAGFSMIKIDMVGTKKEALIVGAPYANSEGVNSGRIYLYCSERSGRDLNINTYNDFLDGPTAGGFFGYALSSIGKLGRDVYLIAVGQPFLNKEESGRVFIVKVNQNCTFNEEPLQILKPEADGSLFGMVLPKNGADMNLDGTNDIVIPVQLADESVLAKPKTFLSRPIVNAKCQFSDYDESIGYGPITESDTLRITVETTYDDEHFFAKHLEGDTLFHLLDPDSTKTTNQRFKVKGIPEVQFNHALNAITSSFDLVPLMPVEKMVGIDNGEDPLIVKFRSIEKCANNDCTDEWNNLSFVDWSSCKKEIRIPRFSCPPAIECTADVSMEVYDEDRSVFVSTNVEREKTIEMIYGNKISAHKEILIAILNNGPTTAGHVELNLKAFGNIKIEKLHTNNTENTLAISQDDNDSFSKLTFKKINYNLGPKEMGDYLSRGMMEIVTVGVYYENFNDLKNSDYSVKSGVKVLLKSGTIDQNLSNNEMVVNFKIVNKPEVRVTPGQDFISNVLDKSKSKDLVVISSTAQKVSTSKIGPRLHHSYVVEHIGAPQTLENVTIKIKVPVAIRRSYLFLPESSPDNQIFYFFKSIRSYTNSEKRELYSLPQVTRINPETNQMEVLSNCTMDEGFVNPLNLNPLLEKAGKRVKRSVNNIDPTVFVDEDRPENQSVIPEYRKLIRRTSRDVFQCGRKGVHYGEPICAEIVCKVPTLERNQPVNVTVSGYLWAKTFFVESIPDPMIVSTLTVDQGDMPDGVELAEEPVVTHYLWQSIFFEKIEPKFFHQVPIWPIVVGVCSGIVIIGVVAAALYRLGFFKRRKRQEHVQRAKIDRNLSEERKRLNDTKSYWDDNTLEVDIASDVQNYKSVQIAE